MPGDAFVPDALAAWGVEAEDGSLRISLKHAGTAPGYADAAVPHAPSRYPTALARMRRGGEWTVGYGAAAMEQAAGDWPVAVDSPFRLLDAG